MEIISISVWRDFMPGNPASGLLASVDIRDANPTRIRVTHNGQSWESPLRFTYYLENQHPERGSRYHSVNNGPDWPVNTHVRVFIFVGNKWINAGVVTIGATY